MRAPRVRGVIGPAWWSLLASLGLPRDRWKSFPKWQRRAMEFGLWGGIAFLVVLVVSHDYLATVITFAVIAALIVPPWHKVPSVGRYIVPVALLVIVVMYPFYYVKEFTMPIFGSFPGVGTAVVMVIFIMMAIGLNMVVGYAGLLDLGYVAFYAMGAYTAAWFASLQFPQVTFHFGDVGVPKTTNDKGQLVDQFGFHVSIWLLLLLAGITTAVIGVLIGLPTLRLRGDYLAIVTLGFGEIMPQVANNGNDLFGTGFNLTGGPQGITPVDAPGFGKTLSDATGGFLPEVYTTCCQAKAFGHQISFEDLFFWTGLVLLLFTIFCSVRLRDSRLGRAWVAIREDEIAAAAMGIPLMRTKTWAYASGAFFGGIAGAYFVAFKQSTFPGDFFFNISVFILCMVILGGMGNIWGVMLGAAFLAYLDREGLANTGAWLNEHGVSDFVFGKDIDVPLYASGIYGTIILLVMLFRPEGLIPDRRRQHELHEGVADQPLYDVDAQTG